MAIDPSLLRGEADVQGRMGGREWGALGVATARVAGDGDSLAVGDGAVGEGTVGDGAVGCISAVGCVAGEDDGAAGDGSVGLISSGSGARVRVHV